MSVLQLVLTNAGATAFAAAQAGPGEIDLAVAEVGFTDQEFVVAPTLTALPGEARRVSTFAGASVGDDIVHLIVRDDDNVGYGVRGFGLYLEDGTLFAVHGQAERIVQKSVASALLLAVDIAFPATTAANLVFGDTNFLDPPATTTTPGVIAIATQAEVDAGASTGKAVTPSRLKSLLAARLAALVPIGTITLWFGAVPPAGWAICNGQTLAKSDGSGDVTLPDLRGRVPVGASADHALGEAFGATEKTVNTTDNPSGFQVNVTPRPGVAGGGTGTTVESLTTNDPGHHHAVTVDVTQPSLALHYIMKV